MQILLRCIHIFWISLFYINAFLLVWFITWMVKFCNPRAIMICAQNVSIISGHHFWLTKVKTSATWSVFLKEPSIRTMICVLSEAQAQEGAKSQQKQLHDSLCYLYKMTYYMLVISTFIGIITDMESGFMYFWYMIKKLKFHMLVFLKRLDCTPWFIYSQIVVKFFALTFF